MAEVVVKLTQLKTRLGITTSDFDSQLNFIAEMVTNALRFKLGLEANTPFPSELNYIAYEVAVKRFNRLKNEGMQSYSQEGESITYNSNDFDEFLDDINEWKRRKAVDKRTLGTVMFLNPFGYR